MTRQSLLYKKVKNPLTKAHEAHREIIHQSATNPNSVKTPFILIHAEDHLMSAISELSIFEELINVYKIINEIKNRRKYEHTTCMWSWDVHKYAGTKN